MAIYAGGPPKLKGITYFDLLFATIIHSPNPTFVPSLNEIGNLCCITSCLVLTHEKLERYLSKSQLRRNGQVLWSDCKIPVHLFAYCLLLFKNETLITIECVHMTSRRPCWRSKQRNGVRLGGVKYSFGA